VNPAHLEADEVRAVRGAAAGWRRAGAIDDPTFRAILDLYPPVRRAFGPVLTTVVFLVSSVAIWAAFGAMVALLRFRASSAFGGLFFVGAVALVLATEVLLASKSFGESGAASAAALWAAVFFTCGIVALAEPNLSESFARLAFGAGTLAFAAAAWRWAWPLFAGASAFLLFWFLAGPVPSRPLLVLIGLVLAGCCSPFLDRADLPLARRESAHAVLLVSLLWAYVLANRFSVDFRLVEELFGRQQSGPVSPAWRLGSAILTGLIPAAVLTWGLRTHRRTILGAGILTAALSLATLRHFVHVAPAWLVLAGVGGLLVAGSVALERWLRAGPSRERFGFTAEPLFENEARQKTIGVVVAASAFSPEAAPRPPEIGSRFAGGGGNSGGGGADESF
jgi:hypothetical protein